MQERDDQAYDTLLGCLSILCRLEDMPFSKPVALAGLPVEKDGLTPRLFVRAAKNVNFSATIAERKLRKINHLSLPAVLILENSSACVMTDIRDGMADIYFPENPDECRQISVRELSKDYTGYAIFATPHHESPVADSSSKVVDFKSWFWGVIFRYKGIFGHVMIAAFITNLFALTVPVFIMNVYDRVIPTNSLSTLWVLAIGALIFFVFDFLARILRGYLIDVAGRRADMILASELFQQLMSLRMRQKPASAGAFNSSYNEFETLREFFTSATLVAIIDIPFTLLFIAAIYFIGGAIVLIPIVAVFIIGIVAYLLELPTARAIKEAVAGSKQKSSILVEAINGLETIKTISAEGLFQREWENAIATQSRANLYSRILTNLSVNFAMLAQQVVIVAVVVYGVFLIQAAQLTVGGLIAITIISGRVMMLGQIVNLSSRLARSMQTLRTFNELMSLKHERSKEHNYLHRPKIKGDIEFEKVTFVYPKRRINALEDVSVRINAGEKVGIIGKIGSGKSTLLKLLTSLYAPSSGAILIDGTDNSEIDPADLRNNVRLVASDNTLFYGSVKDNILMGAAHISDGEFLRAAKIAGVDRFVSQSPLGYDMPVGERGEILSSGQRQAVILARSLVAHPSVLCLDEPSAGVDNGFERDLIGNLQECITNKTLLLVTHRLPMLQLVDRLIVLDRGRIVADGPKEEVMQALRENQSKHDNNSENEE